MNIILASTSTLFGGNYLEYLTEELVKLYHGIDEILFIPFARPGGISHDDYSKKVAEYFEKLNIKVKGLHEFDNKITAINNAKAYFTGGGNTFLLVKILTDQFEDYTLFPQIGDEEEPIVIQNWLERKLMNVLKENVMEGKPYLGTSAGSNIGGLNMQTTNDMPIVYPDSFECMGLVPFNINPHFLDPNPELKHNGETRETRILEFLTQNDTKVVGLREGNWIRRIGNTITVEGLQTTRIFEKGKTPYEIESGTSLS
jgi:dipeptidase E